MVETRIVFWIVTLIFLPGIYDLLASVLEEFIA
jgi:hypothetical protein